MQDESGSMTFVFHMPNPKEDFWKYVALGSPVPGVWDTVNLSHIRYRVTEREFVIGWEGTVRVEFSLVEL